MYLRDRVDLFQKMVKKETSHPKLLVTRRLLDSIPSALFTVGNQLVSGWNWTSQVSSVGVKQIKPAELEAEV